MHLKLANVGQIVEADLRFGDLTVFVGPQATGKSIALQFLKLMVDAGHVQDELSRYGLDWSGRVPEFFDIYFGEGMRSLWDDEQSAVTWNSKAIDVPKLVGRRQRNKDESLFFIPAQRVLTLRDGWPRPFTDYSPGDPFAVREYSERLRTLVEKEFGANENLFPQDRRLKKEFRDMLERSVFAKFRLQVDKSRVQKRLVLETSGGSLPYMVWSAGQREFVPLLLGLYWLMPPTKVSRRGDIEWVVLEELEMGLHPRAISVLLLMVLELVARGYRVCLSTHSPQILEAVWALRHLKANGASPSSLLALFGAPSTHPLQKLAESVMTKTFRVHYFDPVTGRTKDISNLDPDAEESGDGGWGGLTEFSGRANAAVARAVANSGREAER
ncbi:MAG: AAA family ATPase [Pirellulaceae bacterium]|nr:AAA family ATPase [Pirellulaceae bacterium]